MAERDPGWAWFDGPPAVAGADDLARAFARCLRGDDGARVLAHLRERTLERSLGPDASDAALRYLEGQRCLVAHVLALVARGGAA
jgi:hypothetical protein